MKKILFVWVIVFLSQIHVIINAYGEEPKELFRVKVAVSSQDTNLKNETISALKSELRKLGDVLVTDEADATWFVEIVTLELLNKRNDITGIAYSVIITQPFDNKILIPYTKSDLTPEPEKQTATSQTKKKDSTKVKSTDPKLSAEDRAFNKKMEADRKLLDKWAKQNEWATKIASTMINLPKSDPVKDVQDMTAHLAFVLDHQIRVGERNAVQNICRAIIVSFDTEFLEPRREDRRNWQEIGRGWNLPSMPGLLDLDE